MREGSRIEGVRSSAARPLKLHRFGRLRIQAMITRKDGEEASEL